ncbi:MAG: hypothetical protein NTU72_04555 [Fimbriimonadales bacterium]|nr:hypothetical protein [Fimbriimonadales bacterium]
MARKISRFMSGWDSTTRLYNEKISEVWRSPSTDELFDIGGRNQVSAAYSIGFTGKVNERSQFGFGYHTMLGWNVTYSIKHRK